ncbi:tRNA pseudouridine synthase 1 [Favolaschia claudopus]|uniref:tRNA pseudouridine synthase 1 n=1 Tax=Favolaschia claudopus TaxID=2862362 RepID=A0AAW0AGN1_9AGAR
MLRSAGLFLSRRILQSCLANQPSFVFFDRSRKFTLLQTLRAGMDPATIAKRPHEEEDNGTQKRVKTTEDMEKEEVNTPEEGSADAGEKPKKARDGFPKNLKNRKGKEKNSRNPTRDRRGTRNREAAELAEAGEGEGEASGEPKAPRLPKRMRALLIGFCGSGYKGMQIQQNAKTIENALFDAMVRAGAVSQDNSDDPVKVGIHRAARTDAGVHAAGNVVSLKMITNVPGVPDMTARINEELPPEIRLWGHIRVQNSFNPRTLCDSRKYTYFFPTYTLIPPKPGSAQHRVLTEHAASLTPAMPSPIVDHPFWADSGDDAAADMARKRAWRIDPEQVAQLRVTAKKYLGTHNFHNFTVDGAFSDRSNQRYMKDMEISDPVVYGETEWISVLFHGQSFMMHQRKMMSILVLSCRTGTPAQVIDELYGPRDVLIPKMPALGLLLEEPLFDTYNLKVARANEKVTPDHADYRPPITFEPHREAMAAFKEKYVYDNMRRVEDRDGLFDAWIRMVDAYGGNDLLYLNPKGTIPQAAVIKLRERHRKGGFKEKKLFDATSFPEAQQSLGVEEEDEDEEAMEMDKRKRIDTEG